jgi:hypothetical protein
MLSFRLDFVTHTTMCLKMSDECGSISCRTPLPDFIRLGVLASVILR